MNSRSQVSFGSEPRLESLTGSEGILPSRYLQKGGIENLWHPGEFFPEVPVCNKWR